MTDTDTVEWAPPAPRTVTDINRDLHGVDDRLRDIQKPLSTPRNRLAGAISTSDDTAYITAARAEFLPALEAAEADAIAAYDAEIVRLQADAHLLSGSGFTPRLDPDDAVRLPATLAIAQAHLERFDAPASSPPANCPMTTGRGPPSPTPGARSRTRRRGVLERSSRPPSSMPRTGGTQSSRPPIRSARVRRVDSWNATSLGSSRLVVHRRRRCVASIGTP